MDASDYNLIELLDRIYLNEYCCPMPRKWAELSKHVCSTVDHAKANDQVFIPFKSAQHPVLNHPRPNRLRQALMCVQPSVIYVDSC